MASTARIDELKKKFDENPRRYFAPLANEFRKSGDIDQAILICEEFLPQQPGHMSGHIVYGQALFEAGRMPESRTVFETALGLDPENLIALRHLGDIAKSQSDMATARNWYVRVLEADPRNDEIQALIASLDVAGGAPASSPEPDAAQDRFAAPAPERHPEPSFLAPDPVPEPQPAESFAAPEPVADAHGAHASFDLSLVDTQPLGVPAIPTPAPTTDLLDGFSLHGFDGAPDDQSHETPIHSPAVGLESTSFTAPDESIHELPGLDSSLESGVPSFDAPETPVPSLAGLQGSGGMDTIPDEPLPQHVLDAAFTPGFPAVELDDELVLPPQGDPLAHSMHDADASAPVEPVANSEPELLDFDMPVAEAEFSVPESAPDVADAAPDIEPSANAESPSDIGSKLLEIGALAPDEPEIAELAPTAAESAADFSLSDDFGPVDAPIVEEPQAAEEVPAVADAALAEPEAEPDEPAPVAKAPFVTETMAELYVAQGFREQALSVYTQLLAASPADERLQGLVTSLSAPSATESGPTARDFFARIANRRPAASPEAVAPPSFDDFADEPQQEPVAAVAEIQVEETLAAEPPLPPAAAESPARAAEGSIDALFGNRSPGMAEDSAAAALAQAFGTRPEAVPTIVGNPARAADGELSLDSVFRDSPARQPRTSQSFSFDQFFSGQSGAAPRSSGPAAKRASSELPMPGDPPAERSADDIEQFNNWLQGLKQR